MLLFKAPLKHLRLILSSFLWKYITLPTWTHLHKQLFIDDLRVIFHLLLSSSTSDLSCQLYFQNASRIPRLLITTITAVLVQTTISATCTTYWLGPQEIHHSAGSEPSQVKSRSHPHQAAGKNLPMASQAKRNKNIGRLYCCPISHSLSDLLSKDLPSFQGLCTNCSTRDAILPGI